MKAGRIVLRGRRRQRLLRLAKKCDDPHLRVRYLAVVHSADGWPAGRVARALGCCESTVKRARSRWREGGEGALADRRRGNGRRKADGSFVAAVKLLLSDIPAACGHRRPTWTQPLLVEAARRYTGTLVSVTTMGRVLARVGARRGRAKPLAPCPWPEARKARRMEMIRWLVESLPPDEAAVWESERNWRLPASDEVDVELNPRIGSDWMLPGTQRRVMTPGTNVKRHLAGALDARSDRLVWVRGEKKDSRLFMALLGRLLKEYPDKRPVHVILDNYGIHTSRRTRDWLARHGQRIRLHFLPPYCPDDNRIERRVWRELHANVTTNHEHRTIDDLMDAVTRWLKSRNRQVSESRKAI